MSQYLKTLGAVTVTTSGTRVQINSSELLSTSVVISAPAANTGKVYIGDVTVSTTNGIEVAPGGSITISADQFRGSPEHIDISKLYVDAATNGDKIRVAYLWKV